MLRKLTYIIMPLPVMIAACLTFSVVPVAAVPLEQVVAFDIVLPETPPTDAPVQVAQAEDLPSTPESE